GRPHTRDIRWYASLAVGGASVRYRQPRQRHIWAGVPRARRLRPDHAPAHAGRHAGAVWWSLAVARLGTGCSAYQAPVGRGAPAAGGGRSAGSPGDPGRPVIARNSWRSPLRPSVPQRAPRLPDGRVARVGGHDASTPQGSTWRRPPRVWPRRSGLT